MADYVFEGSFEGKAAALGEAAGTPVSPLLFNDQRDEISGDVVVAGNMAVQQSTTGLFVSLKLPDGSWTPALFLPGQ